MECFRGQQVFLIRSFNINSSNSSTRMKIESTLNCEKSRIVIVVVASLGRIVVIFRARKDWRGAVTHDSAFYHFDYDVGSSDLKP